ncbi:sigma-70 family RNA polymerase sigma factor [Clostridium sp. LIBA-8841]|uniref:sigma-70 family RNA polymerase sigma factor n=1 Tax=Clostridium sp. LIBA-8841 TaxID=2987530 RepID=UPI002AC38F49|nr:sigma-70 family RNA polymerase sigma factor [Clostridium sp. LIBA-8841]MDZ5253765.1 sigma-70 family RNA polymerase sigma factor [Clostridium sp. LIBA-8841]
MNKEMVDLLLIYSKKGNKEAMEKLFEIHKGLIYKYSTKYFIKGYDRKDLEQIAWIEFINGVKKYDGKFEIDFVAFITILLRNKYGSMLKKKESILNFSSLDTPIGEDITIKDTLEDDFSMGIHFENREEHEALINAMSSLSEEERAFILYINEERGNMQKYYEKHKDKMSFNAVRYKKKKIMDKLQKGFKDRGIKII